MTAIPPRRGTVLWGTKRGVYDSDPASTGRSGVFAAIRACLGARGYNIRRLSITSSKKTPMISVVKRGRPELLRNGSRRIRATFGAM